MKTLLNRFINNESGATAIEYGLIAAFVSIAIIGGLTIIGPELTEIFSEVGSELAGR